MHWFPREARRAGGTSCQPAAAAARGGPGAAAAGRGRAPGGLRRVAGAHGQLVGAHLDQGLAPGHHGVLDAVVVAARILLVDQAARGREAGRGCQSRAWRWRWALALGRRCWGCGVLWGAVGCCWARGQPRRQKAGAAGRSANCQRAGIAGAGVALGAGAAAIPGGPRPWQHVQPVLLPLPPLPLLLLWCCRRRRRLQADSPLVIEVLDLSSEARGELGGIKAVDGAHTGHAVQQPGRRAPGQPGRGAQGRGAGGCRRPVVA
jgi:hypothetical protein